MRECEDQLILLIECAGELSCTSPKNYPAVDAATRSNKGISALVITRSSMQFNSLFLGREPLPYCRRLEIVCQKVTGTKLEVKDFYQQNDLQNNLAETADQDWLKLTATLKAVSRRN